MFWFTPRPRRRYSGFSERKFFVRFFVRFLVLRLFRRFMHKVSIHKNSLVGNCRACILTMTAPDAYFLVNFWYQQIPLIGHHKNRLCRTTLRTCPAGSLLCLDNTIVGYENNFSDLGQFFCLWKQREQSICRADISSNRAVILTKSFMVVHYWLKHGCQSILLYGRLQELVVEFSDS